MTSVLFVCMGNICRSPTAEGVFRKLHQELAPELDLHIESAGTHDYHLGQAPDGRARAAALRRGIDIGGHRGRQVQEQDFHTFHYILAMDQDNLRRLKSLCPPGASAELRLLLEYAAAVPIKEVPDPYYGNRQDFEQVLDLVEAGGRGLLEEIRQKS